MSPACVHRGVCWWPVLARGLERKAADLSARCSGSASSSLPTFEQMVGHTALSDPPSHTLQGRMCACVCGFVCLKARMYVCVCFRNVPTFNMPH